LVQGGIQALSRSFYARIIPAEKSAEYFGFYNMLGKFAVVIGPALIGGVGLLARRMGAQGSTPSRIGITSIALLFILGGVLLLNVNEQRAKKEIQSVEG
jgi:UMF1 family MFS transporter